MSRRLATRVCLLVLAAACPAWGQLDLDGPPSPSAYITATLEAVEGQVADRVARLNDVDPADAIAVEAQKHYRLVARRLLIVGRDAGDRGAVAVVTATRLLDAAVAMDALLESLPRQAKAALEAESPDPEAIRRLRRGIDALRRFNERAEDQADDLTGADGASVDAYAQRVLAPLAEAVAVLGHPARPAWPVRTDRGVAPARLVSGKDLSALARRTQRANMTDATRQQLRITIDRLQRARGEADLQPAVSVLYFEVARLADAADAFAGAGWLDELSRTQVARQAHEAAVLLTDAKMRDAAVAKIDRLAGATEALDGIGRLNRAGVDTAPLAELLMAAYRLGADTTQAENAQRLMRMAQRISRVAEQQRGLEPGKLPADIKTVFRAVQAQYASQEKRVIAELSQLAADPQQVALARWTTPVNRLEALGALTERLNQVPRWMAQMKRLNPAASSGMYRQLRLITSDLLNEATRAGAAEALAEIDRQLRLFERLPHEATLDDANSALRRGLGRHEPEIRKQLVVLRSQWAAAWAAGADPTEPGRKLMLMRRLFEQLHEAAQLSGSAERVGKLGRWAAWQVAPGAIEPFVAEAPRQLGAAAAQAAAGQWQTLATTLDAIERQAPVARLATRLLAELGGALPDGEAGPADALGQTLFAPPPTAYGLDWRLPLAQVAVLVDAAEHARAAGDADRARRLGAAAGDLARQLMRRAAGSSEPLPAAPPFEAIDV
jgi:hypothetical protein